MPLVVAQVPFPHASMHILRPTLTVDPATLQPSARHADWTERIHTYALLPAWQRGHEGVLGTALLHDDFALHPRMEGAKVIERRVSRRRDRGTDLGPHRWRKE